jgi:hypothetical protein
MHILLEFPFSNVKYRDRRQENQCVNSIRNTFAARAWRAIYVFLIPEEFDYVSSR